MASLLVVAHLAPAVDHRLCLQLATYPHRTMFYHVYCTVQIRVYYLLRVRALKKAPLNPSVFVNFPTHREYVLDIFASLTGFHAVFLANLLNSCYYL